MPTIIPPNYQTPMGLAQTERAVKLIKDHFEHTLAAKLDLLRVSAPLFVRADDGVQDNLNGIERAIGFEVLGAGNVKCEIVQSLAKWKRQALYRYEFEAPAGIYTDMNALRPDEAELDNLHSVYVDQWDWERIMRPGERNLDYLKDVVRDIYEAMRLTEAAVADEFGEPAPSLPEEIVFIHTEELIERYGDGDRVERERLACQEHGAVFIIGIGGPLADGKPHDGRAPDYDDWITPTTDGRRGLNGDIVVWNPLLEIPFELSSMGIRVDAETMLAQLAMTDNEDRKELAWHQSLLDGRFPQTIGGGIGQSRLCMLLLRRAHIGEVQVGIWPDHVHESCAGAGIRLL